MLYGHAWQMLAAAKRPHASLVWVSDDCGGGNSATGQGPVAASAPPPLSCSASSADATTRATTLRSWRATGRQATMLIRLATMRAVVQEPLPQRKGVLS